MPESIWPAIIAGIFSIIVALINNFGQRTNNRKSTKSSTFTTEETSPIKQIFQRGLFLIVVFGVTSSVCTVSQAVYQWTNRPTPTLTPTTPTQPPYKTVDFGSVLNVDDLTVNKNQEIIIYRHHPVDDVNYGYITLINGSLPRVEQICGSSTIDITDMFSSDNDRQKVADEHLGNPEIDYYLSSELYVSDNCHIDFWVKQKVIENNIVGIHFDATYSTP